ncbi:hypothetical protein RSAG8_11625, partial [Rhizoctonia solani AG-8 WAC10335]
MSKTPASLTNPNSPTLAGLLTLQQTSSIFYDYLREIPDANKAIFTLPRKLHLGTAEDQIERLSDREYDEHSRKNIARWISAHVVPSHPIELVGSHSTMLGGKSIDFECKDEGEGEKTWEHCMLDHGVSVLQRVEVRLVILS